MKGTGKNGIKQSVNKEKKQAVFIQRYSKCPFMNIKILRISIITQHCKACLVSNIFTLNGFK